MGFNQYRTRQTSVIHCTLAAHDLGMEPRLVYAGPNLSVTDFVVGTDLQLEQMKELAIMRDMDGMEKGKATTGSNPSPWA